MVIVGDIEPKPLAGRVALVTGGARGIGAAIARGLAMDGADVAITYSKSADAATEVVQQLQALGRRSMALRGLIEDAEASNSVVTSVVEDLGCVDILVHNAGIVGSRHTVAQTDEAEVSHLLRVHAIGPHQLTRSVLPHMRKAPRGDIIFVSSTITRLFLARAAPYAMAKSAMEALAFCLAAEEREHNIHVNIVAPATVDTDLGQRAAQRAGFESLEAMEGDVGFGGVCQPDDVADVVRYMAGQGSRYISGQRVYVDAGVK